MKEEETVLKKSDATKRFKSAALLIFHLVRPTAIPVPPFVPHGA